MDNQGLVAVDLFPALTYVTRSNTTERG